MSAALQRASRGSYQRVLYRGKAPEAQISTTDGVTTLVLGDADPKVAVGMPNKATKGISTKKKASHPQDRAAQSNQGRGEGRVATDSQPREDKLKGANVFSGKGLSNPEKPQSFSGLRRAL